MSGGGRRHRFRLLVGHLAKQGGLCAYCSCRISAGLIAPGTMMATLDHLDPRKDGGPDTERNTCAACWPCNRLKAHFTPSQLRHMANVIDALKDGHRPAGLIAGAPTENDMAYKYIVTTKGSDTKRLIEASSPANAIAFVASDNHEAERVSDAVAGMVGLTLEKVTAAK